MVIEVLKQSQENSLQPAAVKLVMEKKRKKDLSLHRQKAVSTVVSPNQDLCTYWRLAALTVSRVNHSQSICN